MSARPTVLCPVDFSDASGLALSNAAAIASRFAAQLLVMTVEDPLITEAVDLGTGTRWTPADTQGELEQFTADALGPDLLGRISLDYEIAVGKPATEILRVIDDRDCALTVISTQGLTGMRKLFFGSTTERVLRETTRPVLVTRSIEGEPVRLDDARRWLHRILVAVDLSSASPQQASAAARIAAELGVPPLIVHVVEPVRSRLAARLHLTGIEAERRGAADRALAGIVDRIPARLHPEALVAYGDPAEEIVKIAADRRAGLIVMGLHGSPVRGGPRMGSVTYRILCLAPSMVLGLPAGAGGFAEGGEMSHGKWEM
jgi:nucleotide-binding universal stress UspA family protein